MYKKLFITSELYNTQITKRIGFTHTNRKQYERATKIDFSKFVSFGKKLDVTEAQMTSIVNEGIKEILNIK